MKSEGDVAEYLSEAKEWIDDGLRGWIAQWKEDEELKRMAEYILFPGGKRIRPALFLLIYTHLGGEKERGILPACAIELAHNFTLIQDDLPSLDNAETRRGKPCIHKIYGEASAILISDVLLAGAFSLLAESPFPLSIRLAGIQELFSALCEHGVISGQLQDIRKPMNSRSLDEWLEINRKKTGRLFQASARMAGIFAFAPESTMQMLSNAGLQMGIAFQIADDLEDILELISRQMLYSEGEKRLQEALNQIRPLSCPLLEALARLAFFRQIPSPSDEQSSARLSAEKTL